MGSLWHWDGHAGSRPVLTARGQWVTPVLFGVIDDRSRLACHLQWYLTENAECVAHGLSQAIQKRGLPRAGMSDNGAAMLAAEISEGLARLGIVHETTLAYSPYMNGKIESLWTSVEGRLMAMLEGVSDLTLASLNEATQAWCEYEYNRAVHSETGESAARALSRRPRGAAPQSRQRRATASLHPHRASARSDTAMARWSSTTRRFEVPNRYRHLRELHVRYAQWDLSQVYLLDERSGQILCRLYPQDKQSNARGVRRPLEPLAGAAAGARRQRAEAPRPAGCDGAAAREADRATKRHRLAARLPAQGRTRRRNREQEAACRCMA